MSVVFYAVPIAVIVLIVLIMMPIMKKNAAKVTQGMMEIQDIPVHLFMLAGEIKTINKRPVGDFKSVNHIYGIDEAGHLDIELLPSFTYANTLYTGDSPMHIQFMAEAGKSYQISVEPKEPKGDPNVLACSPVVNQKVIFKTTFYIITKDITEEQDAKNMRGAWK